MGAIVRRIDVGDVEVIPETIEARRILIDCKGVDQKPEAIIGVWLMRSYGVGLEMGLGNVLEVFDVLVEDLGCE